MPLYHEFVNFKNYRDLHAPFAEALLKLDTLPRKIISRWWAGQSKEYFEKLIEMYKGVVTHIINFKIRTRHTERTYIGYEPNLELSLRMLRFLFYTNHQQRQIKVPYGVFHLPELIEVAQLEHDYIIWLMDKNVT